MGKHKDDKSNKAAPAEETKVQTVLRGETARRFLQVAGALNMSQAKAAETLLDYATEDRNWIFNAMMERMRKQLDWEGVAYDPNDFRPHGEP